MPPRSFPLQQMQRKMTKNLAVLQRKLHELEDELADIFRLPLDPTTSDISFADVDQRFVFLDKILAAELASSQPRNSDRIDEIGQRLAKLKNYFREWNQSRTSAFEDHDDDRSVCSECTQARLHDVVRVPGSPIAEAEDFPGEKSPDRAEEGVLYENDVVHELRNSVMVKSPEKFWDSVAEDVKKEAVVVVVAEGKGRMWWKNFGWFGCGVIVGAICMVEMLSYFSQPEAFLVPPT